MWAGESNLFLKVCCGVGQASYFIKIHIVQQGTPKDRAGASLAGKPGPIPPMRPMLH